MLAERGQAIDDVQFANFVLFGARLYFTILERMVIDRLKK